MKGAPAAFLLLLALARGAAAGEGGPVNLLRLPSARVEATTAPGGDASVLRALTDGDPATAAEVPGPLDVVYGFGEGTVAPEGVRVTLPAKGRSDAPAARVEVLVSTVSAHAGFRSVRADPLVAGAPPALLPFPSTAARWILVRLVPLPGGGRVAAAEVEVLGREGRPESRYAFAESPARALDVLERLEKASSLRITITEEEKAMYARARAGRLDAAAFAEAALMASGVLDPAKRREYLARLDALEREARAALAGAKTAAEKGDGLLRWLHGSAMKKGYVESQTDLSGVLDGATFNCVSSATLFNVLALRLGLDVRAVEVPDHAFSILYEGTRHMDVETTTPEGFNPARDPAAVAGFEKVTGYRYIADAHRDRRREVEEAGLAAIIHYNHGVALFREKRYQEALVANFRAMSLDPENGSAVKNALAALATWGYELARDARWEQALEVVTVGLALAPRDATLVNNHQAIWGQWAQASIDAGRPEEAVAILKRAAAAIPGGGFTALQAWAYLKPGEERVKAGRWEEALAVTEAGLAKLDPGPRAEVERWRADLFLRWFNAEIGAGRFDAAGAVLEKGLALDPKDERLRNNAAYLAQEWAAATEKGGDDRKVLEVLRTVKARFPGIEEVARMAADRARRVVYARADAGEPQAALVLLLDEVGDLLPDAKDRRDVGLYVIDRQARGEMKAGNWREAADAYASGFALYPDEELLRTNAAFLVQEWARERVKTDGAEASLGVLRYALEQFPGVEGVARAAEAHVARTVNDLAAAGKYEEAVGILEKGADLVPGKEAAAGVARSLYDRWAGKLAESGKRQEAVDVYARALERLPGDAHLVNNAVATFDQWARTFMDRKDWDGAIGVYDRGLERFPDQPVLKQNRAYCVAQKGR